jgi:hypothetical protein
LAGGGELGRDARRAVDPRRAVAGGKAVGDQLRHAVVALGLQLAQHQLGVL